MIKISPSILAADFARLGEESLKIERAGAELLHIDVMDGHFVPNITIGSPVIKSLRRATSIPFDVHLMIERPSEKIDAFLDAGADIVTFHLEAEPEPKKLIERIRNAGVLPSMSVKPATPAQALFPYLDSLAMVLVMTVEPGFGGQKLIESCLEKAAAIREEAVRRGLSLDIEADGGINSNTITHAAESGINVFVAGSAVFCAADPALAVKELRDGALKASSKAPWLR